MSRLYERMRAYCTCLDCENYAPSPWSYKQGICTLTAAEKNANGRWVEHIVDVEFVDDEFTIEESGCDNFVPTEKAEREWRDDIR